MNQKIIRFFLPLTLLILVSCSEETAKKSDLVKDKYQEGVHFELLKNPSAVRISTRLKWLKFFGLAVIIAMLLSLT